MSYPSQPRSTPLSPTEVTQILTHLSLPPNSHLPLPPTQFLEKYLEALPPDLAGSVGRLVGPRERSKIGRIKRRRILWAGTEEGRRWVGWEEGGRRWGGLFARMGGGGVHNHNGNRNGTGNGPGPGPGTGNGTGNTTEQTERGRAESDWALSGFMPTHRPHVGRLNRLLGAYEEEREGEELRDLRRGEREWERVREMEGEEFESSDDDDDEGQEDGGEEEEGLEGEELKRAFEKKVLELFLDGMDTIPYDPIDLQPPSEPDPIAAQDAEDRYFDSESEVDLAPASRSGAGRGSRGGGGGGGQVEGADDVDELGEDEFDY